MKQFKLLIKLQLKEYLAFLTSTKLSLRKKILIIILPIVLILLAVSSSLSTAFIFIPVLLENNKLDLLPPIMMLITFFIILFITAKTIKSMVFLSSDISFLKTLPLKPSYITLSKILIFYLLMVLLSLVMLLGTDILLIIMTSSGWSSLVLNIFLALFIPILPILLAILLILPLAIMAKYYKVSKLIKILDIFFSFVFLVALILLTILAPLMNEVQVNILENLINYFFLTYFYKMALTLDILYILIFVLINMLLNMAFLVFLNKYYFRIHNVLSRKDKKKDYKSKYLKNTPTDKILFSKEVKMYKSSNAYLMNTIVFPVILATTAIATIILRLIGVLELLFESDSYNLVIMLITPVILNFNAFTATTAYSISLEGKNFYILKVLPLKTSQIINAKIKLHVLVLGLVPAISSIIIGLFLNAGILFSLMFGFIVIVHSYFMANLGIIVNLFFPKLEFKSEQSVIKNSLATLVLMLVSQFMLIAILVPLGIITFNGYFQVALILLIFLIVLITIITRLFVVKKSEILFNKIG